MIRVLASVFVTMILVASVGCATYPYNGCAQPGFGGQCGPAMCDPCGPAPFMPAPCGPAPCDPTPCGPVPCAPAACEPAPCMPAPCVPSPCGQGSCPSPGGYPCNCQNGSVGMVCPVGFGNGATAGMGVGMGPGTVCPPAPVLGPPLLKLPRAGICNRNQDPESELYVTRGPRDFFDPNPNKVRY